MLDGMSKGTVDRMCQRVLIGYAKDKSIYSPVQPFFLAHYNRPTVSPVSLGISDSR